MLLIALCCLSASPVQFSDAEYIGPAYASGGKPNTIMAGAKGAAIIFAVEAGVGPDWIERLFGPPLLSGRFNKGPIEWSYGREGVTVYFPARLFKPGKPYERLNGNIGP
ncbi:hypothetical protein [Zavarzinella formosa]|uniref:hypothetical protein n=1 Tax=Zavarzinella formosa TaxID=360055 RepID=UPI0002EF9127|nr:hypothetical protein [Zavarzinella formosa]